MKYNAVYQGVNIYGGSYTCYNQLILEDQEHMLLHYDFAKLVWNWVSSLL